MHLLGPLLLLLALAEGLLRRAVLIPVRPALVHAHAPGALIPAVAAFPPQSAIGIVCVPEGRLLPAAPTAAALLSAWCCSCRTSPVLMPAISLGDYSRGANDQSDPTISIYLSRHPKMLTTSVMTVVLDLTTPLTFTRLWGRVEGSSGLH